VNKADGSERHKQKKVNVRGKGGGFLNGVFFVWEKRESFRGWVIWELEKGGKKEGVFQGTGGYREWGVSFTTGGEGQDASTCSVRHPGGDQRSPGERKLAGRGK